MMQIPQTPQTLQAPLMKPIPPMNLTSMTLRMNKTPLMNKTSRMLLLVMELALNVSLVTFCQIELVNATGPMMLRVRIFTVKYVKIMHKHVYNVKPHIF